MRLHLLFVVITGLLVGCAEPDGTLESGKDAAEAQAELSPDPEQARLLREVARSGAAEGLQDLRVEGDAVRQQRMKPYSDRPVDSTRQEIPESVDAAVIVMSVPEIEAEFSGRARVESVDGQLITLDLGDRRLLRFQAKVRGARLRARAGESVEVFLRQGDPFARNDVLALRFEGDDLIYAVVGGTGPVRLEVPTHGLSAAQKGKPVGNTMAVSVTVGGETQTLAAGEQADFRTGRLTVRVTASVAVQGPAAHALEGRPYRLEILGWRTSAD